MTAEEKPTLQRVLKMSKEELEAFRDMVLVNLNLDMARKMFPMASSDEVLLASMHKARYELGHMPDALRRASRTWLEDRGFHRWHNQPWSEDGSFPS